MRSPSPPLSPGFLRLKNRALWSLNRELRQVTHGFAVAELADGTIPACLPLLSLFSARSDLDRSDLIQWPKIGDTPSIGILQIRPYNYFRLNPQSKARLHISFSLYKSVFWFGFIEIRFQLFTVLPFNLF